MLQDIGSHNLKEKHIYTKVYIYICIFFKQYGKDLQKRPSDNHWKKIDSKEDVSTLNSTHLWKVITLTIDEQKYLYQKWAGDD